MKCQYCGKEGAKKVDRFNVECDACHKEILKGQERAKNKPSKTFLFSPATGRSIRIRLRLNGMNVQFVALNIIGMKN